MSASTATTPQNTRTLLPETEAERIRLRKQSWVLLVCGVVGFVGAFATYFLGFVLAVCYFVAVGISLNHTKTPSDVMRNTCCFPAHSAFSSLRSFFMVIAVGTAIGIVFCIAGIAVHAEETEVKAVDVVFAVFALIACLVGLPVSYLASRTAAKLHIAVDLVLNKQDTIVVAGGSIGVIQQGDVVMGTVQPMGQPDPANNYSTNNRGPAPYGHPGAETTMVQVTPTYPAAIPIERSNNGPQIYSNDDHSAGQNRNEDDGRQYYPVQPADNLGYCSAVQQQPVYNSNNHDNDDSGFPSTHKSSV